MTHSIKIVPTFRCTWPFKKMKVGESITIKGDLAPTLYQRAIAASYHYKSRYDYDFKSIQLANNEYLMWRTA